MTPVAYPDYRCGCLTKGTYKLLMNSMDPKYGGTEDTARSKTSYTSEKAECDGKPYSIAYDLPGYGCAVFVYQNEKKTAKPAVAKTVKPAVKKDEKAPVKKPAVKKK